MATSVATGAPTIDETAIQGLAAAMRGLIRMLADPNPYFSIGREPYPCTMRRVFSRRTIRAYGEDESYVIEKPACGRSRRIVSP